MELSLREAAALLGRKERTLRAQLSRGEVRGGTRDEHSLAARTRGAGEPSID